LATYTYAQLEGFWIGAGGSQATAPIAAAIGMAESGGADVIQQNQPYDTEGWGIWQITPGDSEPQDGTDNALLNPQNNAKAAVAKWEAAGESFEPWTTFTSGKYFQFLQGNVPASASSGTPTSTTALGGALSIPGQITGFFSDADGFVNKAMWLVNPSSWLRIGAFLIGIALLLFAIHAMIAAGNGSPLFQMPNAIPVPV
jgi:hypothetical protein